MATTNKQSLKAIDDASASEPLSHAILAIIEQIERLAGDTPASNNIDEVSLRMSEQKGAKIPHRLIIEAITRSLSRIDRTVLPTTVLDHAVVDHSDMAESSLSETHVVGRNAANTAWINRTPVFVSASEPTTPGVGDLWLDVS